MPASGVKIHDDCFHCFKDIKENKKLICVIFGFSSKDMDEIKVIKTFEKTGENEEEQVNRILTDFVDGLTMPHYIVWDLKLPTKSSADVKATGCGEQKTEKLIYTGLCLDTMNVKVKMMFSSSVKALFEKMEGIPKKCDLRCTDECNYKFIIENSK